MIRPQLDARTRQLVGDFIREDRKLLLSRMVQSSRARLGDGSFASSFFFAGFLDRLNHALSADDIEPLQQWVSDLANDRDFDSESSRLISLCCAVMTESCHHDLPGFEDVTAYFTILAVELETAFLNARWNRTLPASNGKRQHVDRDSVLQSLSAVILSYDRAVYQDALGVSSLCARIGLSMGLSPQQTSLAKECGLLHDIGKIGIPQEVLRKGGSLSDAERAVVRTHPELGGSIVGAIPELAEHAKRVRMHHERIDGKGYPDGVKGDAIPVESKIVAVADAFHAMISDRPHQAAMPVSAAIDELRSNRGTQFDSYIIDVLIRLVQPSVVRPLKTAIDISSV
ncbi:MAG: HD domain-containing protein [Candidatus Eremiobacteraeota bacterium]|nr:HD domain-containing protein [Candidatus Eremiobacteraeota bacterium]